MFDADEIEISFADEVQERQLSEELKLSEAGQVSDPQKDEAQLRS